MPRLQLGRKMGLEAILRRRAKFSTRGGVVETPHLRKSSFLFFVSAVVLIVSELSSAQIGGSKVGGACFRVDDDHGINDWYEYARIFDKYGYHFTFALNLQLVNGSEDYFNMIRNLQQSGHELADHTPNHSTQYFTVEDTSGYAILPGVDHVSSNTVFLKHEAMIDTNLYHGQSKPGGALVDIIDGKAYSREPGAFKDFIDDPGYLIGIYIPSTGQLFSVHSLSDIQASDTSNIDTLILSSYWGENIPIPEMLGVWCHFVGQYNVHVDDNALNLIANRTLRLCMERGISRPVTWIQPGGFWPTVYPEQAKRVLGGLGYTAAATDPPSSSKSYNQFDPDGNLRFGMEWGDFNEEVQDLKTMESIIADGIAKHHFLVGHSHFHSSISNWDGYLGRMDSLLAWCKANGVQVVTYSQMAHQLYDVPQNPYVNIIPPLNVDIDHNGIPDGYWIPSNVSLDTTDGVSIDGGKSYAISGTGIVCEINHLAGIERGENDFSISTKGNPGDSVSVSFILLPVNRAKIYKFPASTPFWKTYHLKNSSNGDTDLVIPEGVSEVSIVVTCSNFSGGIVKVSGMQLRKKVLAPIKIVSSPDTLVTRGAKYTWKIQVAVDVPHDTVFYDLATSASWLAIDAGGVLSGISPVDSGVFPVRVTVHDGFGYADSISFNLHVVNSITRPIQIVSTPDTLVAPGSVYYYSIYAVGDRVSDSLQYLKLTGPDWLVMSAGGTLSGVSPSYETSRIPVSLVVRDRHADADTQTFFIDVRTIHLDSFNYDDSPFTHGWAPQPGDGRATVRFDSTVDSNVLVIEPFGNDYFGVERFGRWLAHTFALKVKYSSSFTLGIDAVDVGGRKVLINYHSGDGVSLLRNDVYHFYLGSRILPNQWGILRRNLNSDLKGVSGGVTIRRILKISLSGSLEVAYVDLGVTTTDSSLEGGESVAEPVTLSQNYPNPFNLSTSIRYSLKSTSHITIRVYNVLGQLVSTLLDGYQLSGDHEVRLDATRLSSGCYILVLDAAPVNGGGRYLARQKLMLLK